MQTHLKVPVLKLKQDVITRWNSTYEMLSRFLVNKEPILSCIGILNIKSNLQEVDWKIMEQAVELLEFFYLATQDVCAEKAPTISKIVVLYKQLKLQMEKARKNTKLEKRNT